MIQRRRVLFFSQILATPDYHGGCVYPHALLRELHRQDVAIDYAWLGCPLSKDRRLMRNPLQANWIARSWVRGTRRIGNFLVPGFIGHWFSRPSRLGESALSGEHLSTPDEQAFAVGLVRKYSPNTVLVDGTCNLGLLDSLSSAERSHLRVGVLTHNLQSRRTELYRQHGQPLDFLPLTATEEKALLTRADLIVAIQEREADAFRSLLPGKSVVTVPMPIVPKPVRQIPSGARRCLFVGGHSGHNIEAVTWLLREIWPRVTAVVPQAELVIAGTVGQVVRAPPLGVKIVGPLPNLAEAYAECALSLVPLPMGTGLKIKLVEAMGFGRPVVTTSAGAEGFADLEAGKVAVLADGAEDFAQAIMRLLSSDQLREEIARRQLAWIEKTLRPEIAVAPLAQLWAA